MSAKHGVAGAVFLVLITGPVIRAQAPADLPFVKSPNSAVDPSQTGPGVFPNQPGQAVAPSYPPGQQYFRGISSGQAAPTANYPMVQQSLPASQAAPAVIYPMPQQPLPASQPGQPPSGAAYPMVQQPQPASPPGQLPPVTSYPTQAFPTALPGQMPGVMGYPMMQQRTPAYLPADPPSQVYSELPSEQLPPPLGVFGQQPLATPSTMGQIAPLSGIPGQLAPTPNGCNPYSGPGAQCCGPIGGHGPIGTEFWLATGPDFILNHNGIASALRNGWDVEGGGRSLFFSPNGLTAWSVDASISYTANGGNLGQTFQGLNGPGDNVTIHYLNRSALHAGIGRDWWFCGPGDVGSSYNPKFRFGVDAGGTWGTSHVDLNTPVVFGNYERIQKIYGGAYAGLHLDMEVPLGGWTFVTGIQCNFTDDFLHVLPGDNNIIGLNLLWDIGFRY